MQAHAVRRQDLARRLTALSLLIGVVGLMAVPTAFAHSAVPGAIGAPRAVSGHSGASAAASSSPNANSATFNPNCYPIDQYTCVAIQNLGEPDIVPFAGSHTAVILPNATTSLPLVIKSKIWLNYTNAPHNGSKTPITLNVTSTLWNRDPIYTAFDKS
ncbi:MAG: hypothetical protein L3K09_08280, partial [Thermoplasmata archaeon]|nr:hypothetical protein [Thermoplasmata archaeon]